MDKRKHKRVNASFSFCYRAYRRLNISGGISKIKNISAGGVQLVTSHELNANNILELTFRTPSSRKKITIMGKVLECKKNKKDQLYESRISFICSDKNAREMMTELVKEINPH